MLIATFLASPGMNITNIESASTLVNLTVQSLPNTTAVHTNMNPLDLD